MITSACSFRQVLIPFARLFSKRVFRHATVLLMGAIVAPGRRTVTWALRVMGRRMWPVSELSPGLEPRGLVASTCSRVLLSLLVQAFAPTGPRVFGLDDTVERRWGRRIQARGIYRDPVRSSHGHFVWASGLRWLSLALLAPVPWAGRIWALPFFTALVPIRAIRPADRPPAQADAPLGTPDGRPATAMVSTATRP